MNGPEHYTEAERLLEQVADVVSLNYSTQTGETKADVLAAAQVHATLSTIPSDHLAVYEWTQQRLVERLTEDHCLEAFRDAWMRADAEHDDGNRVRRGMAAAIAEARL